MGDTVVAKLQELKGLGPDTHWFCPRSAADETGTYFDDDVLLTRSDESPAEKEDRLRKVREAEGRRDYVLEACKILAFDGVDAEEYAHGFQEGLARQLSRCDVCIREYHRSRHLLVQNIESEYPSEDVEEFMEKFDKMNILRIGKGLHQVTETLNKLAPEKRNISAAGEEGMYTLFEALNCVPFLTNESVLQEYFDRPFELVQTKKTIKLPSFAPAMACFLYSSHPIRSAWAYKSFTKQIKRPLTASEFEHSVKPFLARALERVQVNFLERGFLPLFWRGTRAVISALTKDLITNHLRAMDHNLYLTSLDHFNIENSSHFGDLLESYQKLLETSPGDFWDALGTISPQTVAEQIFRSPMLQEQLTTTVEKEFLHLESKMDWTVLFIKSIKPINLVTPARTIIDQLLEHLQADQYSRYSRSVNWEKGMTCLLFSLRILKEKVSGGPVVSHFLDAVVSKHMGSILQSLDGIEKKNEMQIDRSEHLCLDIVEAALALDVAALAHDREIVVNGQTPEQETGASGLQLWRQITRQIGSEGAMLASSALAGTIELLSIEKFAPKQIERAPEKATKWNNALGRVLSIISDDMLERLDAFGPDKLLDIIDSPRAVQGIISLLFNGEGTVHQSALNVLKSISGEDNRRDSIMHLIRVHLKRSLDSVISVLQAISEKKLFLSCTTAVKLCTDIFSCLCDNNDGELRTRMMENSERELLEIFWQCVWQLVGTIFGQTEPWSNLGHDKRMLQDFCRESMDFADLAFEQCSILASTFQQTSTKSETDVRKMLLEHPKSKFVHITGWLRLRDEYLITKAVSLARKILGRLRDVGIKVNDNAARYVENVVMSTDKNPKIKTKLSMQQKAELQRALESHLGESLRDVVDVDALPDPKKQRSLEGWASGGRSSGASTPTGATYTTKKPGTIDVDAWSEAAKARKETQAMEDREMKKLQSSMGGAEAYKQRQQQQQQQQQKSTIGPGTVRAAQKNQQDASAFLAQRRLEQEALRKRKLDALAAHNKSKTAGIGSGVAGMGDIGKDHSMKGQNVMVDSDEESEEDDDSDDMDKDLFGPSTKTAKKQERPKFEPGLMPEKRKGPTRIQRMQRNTRDMRARLAPDLTSLHRTILQWDFFHQGDYPPGANEHKFRPVANSFTDPTTYQETFQPLLTLEAWQGMIRAREETSGKPYNFKIQNRTNVDSMLELSSIISHADNREVQLGEGDIILFSKSKKPTEDASAAHCLARVFRVKRQKAHLEIVYQTVPGTGLAPSLVMQAVLWGQKVQSITPLEREYGALQSLQYYDLCNQIVKAQPSKRIPFTEKQIATCQDVWNVNRAQSEAINAALENEGFSLIQGPPGSGKTKTIVAIVGGLLSQALNNAGGATRITLPKTNGPQFAGGNEAPPKKLMVCAPSNAAVDELVMRLKDGVKTKNGKTYPLNVVRLGRSDAINSQVVDVTMDELVSKRLGSSKGDQELKQKNAEIFKEHEKISAVLRELYEQQNSGQVKGEKLGELENDIAAARKKKREFGQKIDNAKDQERMAGREADLNRKKAQQAVLDEAHVICATLSGSGHDMFQSLNIEFETVIIDEAAQCVEMSSLIPLKYGCIKCVMVGDPKQLPPTVFSKEAAKFQYEQSLFVRMQNNFGNEVHLLDTQYRMHPEISVFPSRTFYDGLLKDGEGMARLRQQPWHASALLAPYRFFDVQGQHQAAPKGHSLINLAEIDIAIALFERLTADFKNYEYSGRVGIITPYKSQLRALKDGFAARFGSTIHEMIEFNTTDAFQGRESEIIIFSCVRASPGGGIGFLQDIRRMNVGLTRAKSSLWVLGNSDSLVRGEFWRKLVEDSKSRDRYTTGDLKGMLRKPSSAFPVKHDNTQAMLDVGTHAPQMGSGKGGIPNRSTTASAGNPNPPRLSSNVPKDPDRMDGVSYRFEDRVSKKPTPSVAGTGRPAQSVAAPPPPPRSASPSADVDMADADDTANGSGGATAVNDRAGSGTTTPKPVVGAESKPSNGAPAAAAAANPSTQAGVNGAQGAAVKPQVQQMMRKRPAASPFMPRKQQKPR